MLATRVYPCVPQRTTLIPLNNPGVPTFTRASDKWGWDANGVLVNVDVGVPLFGPDGVVMDVASANKCTCYGAIPADTYGTVRTAGYQLIQGVKYEIISQGATGLNFPSYGAADNNPGTQFVATAGPTLKTGDSVKDVLYGTGTVSFFLSTAYRQRHTNMTVAGDTSLTMTTVDRTADLAAAGLQNLPSGKVYELKSSGPAAATVTITGSSTSLVTSIHLYVMGGTGAIKLTGERGRVSFGASSVFRKVSSEGIVSVSGDRLIVEVDPYQTIYFILPQAEDTSGCTAPMPCSGATKSRAADSLTYAPVASVSYQGGAPWQM